MGAPACSVFLKDEVRPANPDRTAHLGIMGLQDRAGTRGGALVLLRPCRKRLNWERSTVDHLTVVHLENDPSRRDPARVFIHWDGESTVPQDRLA